MLANLALRAVLVALFVLPVAMVRGLISMYRDKDRSGAITGGIAGAMLELDRVVRPSAQHATEVKESKTTENAIGGE